jgi:glyoxylase-like metal-dependent hydrolase (beta-lactamase superfamily II)
MLKVKKIVTGNLEENCYIIESEKDCMIIDPGDDFPEIDKEIKKTVVGVLITHRHQDHIGALEPVIEKYKCQLFDYFSTDEEEYKVREFNFSVINMPGHTSDSVCYYFY